jgi:hypothetical protein
MTTAARRCSRRLSWCSFDRALIAGWHSTVRRSGRDLDAGEGPDQTSAFATPTASMKAATSSAGSG